MKEYSLQEIFEEKEGTEFVTEDNKYRVKVLRGELVHADMTSCAFIKYYTTIKFIKVQIPVSFMEAVQSGKQIKFAEHELIDNDIALKSYSHIASIFKWIGSNFNSNEVLQIVNECKFYIKEE